ncbi:unnamed protein product [Calypogeia fissa]
MTDPITIGLAAGALFVAGVTAVANMSSAYSQYRANHPRKNETGRVENYTASHQGYSLTIQDANHMFLSPYQSYPVMYHAHPYSVPNLTPYTLQQPPALPPPPPPPRQSQSFARKHFPTISNVTDKVLGRMSSIPETPPHQYEGALPNYVYMHRSISAPATPNHHHIPHNYHGAGLQPHVPYPAHGAPYPEHVPRSNSSPPFQYIPPYIPSCSNGPPPTYGYGGGKLVLEKEQRSRDTIPDTNIGMHTGRMRGYNIEMAEVHWSYFRKNSLNNIDGTIAVVNWSERLITMYVYSKDWRQYYRNYHVHHYDLKAFGSLYEENQVFSGILRDSWLMACNDELKIVEDDGRCGVKSKNCWSLLGIQGHIPDDLVFVEMKRAALFGLLQCRSMDPTLLNVDMVGDERLQFVHVDTEYDKNLGMKGNCMFSVFSFANHGWAEDRVLVG